MSMTKRGKYADEDPYTWLERCDGEWKWHEESRRLVFYQTPPSGSANGSELATGRSRRSRGHSLSLPVSGSSSAVSEVGESQERPWPACRTRQTWPNLGQVWDTFGTEPKTPSRQEVSPLVKACSEWLEACHRKVSIDVANYRRGRVSTIHSRVSGVGFGRQSSSVAPHSARSRRNILGMSDSTSLAATIKQRPSAALVAAQLTYSRDGPVTLEVVKEVAALELDFETETPAHDLFDIIRLRSFDDYLMASVIYIETFLYLQDIDNRLKDVVQESFGTNTSSGLRAERQRADEDLEQARMRLCYFYSQSLMPNNTQLARFHHSRGGSWRTSRTNADQMLQEAIFRFTSTVVWIALGRQHWKLVTGELGRVFRGEEFNLSGRLAHKPSEREKELMRQQQRRAVADGGAPMISVRKRAQDAVNTPALTAAVKKNSPLVHAMKSYRTSTATSTQRIMHRPLGIMGRPASDFTPFLEPKPEMRKAKPASGDAAKEDSDVELDEHSDGQGGSASTVEPSTTSLDSDGEGSDGASTSRLPSKTDQDGFSGDSSSPPSPSPAPGSAAV